MGLLTFPVTGIFWLFEEVASQAERAFHDEGALTADLLRLHKRLEAGEIGEEEFSRREEHLAARLTEAAEWNRGRRKPLRQSCRSFPNT